MYNRQKIKRVLELKKELDQCSFRKRIYISEADKVGVAVPLSGFSSSIIALIQICFLVKMMI